MGYGDPSCCATLPVPRAWPIESSVWVIYLGYLGSVLGYYIWVLYLGFASSLQLFRFKLRAGCEKVSTESVHEDRVQLYIYDLSNGLARQLSPMLLNKQVILRYLLVS